jgi:hypothetical protein
LLVQRAVHTRSARTAVVVAVVVSGVSLLASREPTYDPYAWLIWGRQIGEGTLDTVAGPSWKPLPVMLTTPFSWFGDDAAPLLWLLVARTGFLLATYYAYRVAAQIAAPVAGLLAATGVALVVNFTSLSARGNSEGLLVACCLAAVDRHRAGRPTQALALGVVASLLRPEIWPFFTVYALWWACVEERPGARRRRPMIVALLGVAVLALWFVPEKIGSGSFLRGASRAREPVAGSPGQAAHPIVATFSNAAGAVDPVFYAGGVIALALALVAWRRRRSDCDDHAVLVLAAVATAYMVIVAILAQAGFTGNERYVSLPAALVCVLGGVGVTKLVRLAADRFGSLRAPAALIGLIVLALTVAPAVVLADALDHTLRQGRLYDRVDTLIQRAGGPAGVRSCGPIYTGPTETQLIAWKLHLHAVQVGIHPRPPGTILAVGGTAQGRDADFPLRDARRGWVRRATCPG